MQSYNFIAETRLAVNISSICYISAAQNVLFYYELIKFTDPNSNFLLLIQVGFHTCDLFIIIFMGTNNLQSESNGTKI